MYSFNLFTLLYLFLETNQTYLKNSPWGIAMSKASKAGKVLADTLILQVQEHRPVTLIGFSLGARLIFDCLTELVERGAYGLVEEAYLFGVSFEISKPYKTNLNRIHNMQCTPPLLYQLFTL